MPSAHRATEGGVVRRPVLVALPQLEPIDRSTYPMKHSESKAAQEPVGIIISGMSRVQTPSVFAAYVYGPAPTTPEDEPKAA